MLEETRKCTGECGKSYPLTAEHFHRNAPSAMGYAWSCKTCVNARLRLFRQANPDKVKKYNQRYAAANREALNAASRHYQQEKLRRTVLTHYAGGEPTCACCGVVGIVFLAMDHINGDGAAHRRRIGRGGSSTYRWIIRNNFPEGFQVLCHNCNIAKARNGVCPHQKVTNIDAE